MTPPTETLIRIGLMVLIGLGLVGIVCGLVWCRRVLDTLAERSHQQMMEYVRFQQQAAVKTKPQDPPGNA
jgi:hypothetical protein